MALFRKRTPDQPSTPPNVSPAPDTTKGSSSGVNTDPAHQEELRRIYTERRGRITADLNTVLAEFKTGFQAEGASILANNQSVQESQTRSGMLALQTSCPHTCRDSSKESNPSKPKKNLSSPS